MAKLCVSGSNRQISAGKVCRQRGSTIVEGVVGIALVIVILQVCLFFMVHIWQVCVFKQKLATAASQAAQACVDDATNRSYYDSFNAANNLHRLKQIARKGILQSLDTFAVDPDDTDVAVVLDGRLLTVNVTCKRLNLLGAPPILSNHVRVEESATAPVRIVMPPGLLVLTSSSGASVTIPCYGNTITKTDFVRPCAQFSAAIPTPVQCQSTTLGTIIDPNWLNWSPVYP